MKSLIVQSLREGKRVRLRFRGLSMSPLLMPGDEITVQPLEALPRRGDVVLFMASEEFVAHRVVSVRGGKSPSVRLKGDAVRSGFEELPAGELLGFVALRHRGLRDTDFRTRSHRIAGEFIAALSPFAASVLSGMPRPLRRLVRRAFDIALRML